MFIILSSVWHRRVPVGTEDAPESFQQADIVSSLRHTLRQLNHFLIEAILVAFQRIQAFFNLVEGGLKPVQTCAVFKRLFQLETDILELPKGNSGQRLINLIYHSA